MEEGRRGHEELGKRQQEEEEPRREDEGDREQRRRKRRQEQERRRGKSQHLLETPAPPSPLSMRASGAKGDWRRGKREGERRPREERDTKKLAAGRASDPGIERANSTPILHSLLT